VTVKSGGMVRITAWDVGGPGKIRCMWEHYFSVAKGWLAVILLSINLTFNGAYKINGNPDKTNCHAIFIFLNHTTRFDSHNWHSNHRNFLYAIFKPHGMHDSFFT
jgi:hypothetical protein